MRKYCNEDKADDGGRGGGMVVMSRLKPSNVVGKTKTTLRFIKITLRF